MTVAGSLGPPASPTEATEQPYFIWPSARASIVPPTASMQPAQVSDSSGRLVSSARSARGTRRAAPRSLRYASCSGRPVTAATS